MHLFKKIFLIGYLLSISFCAFCTQYYKLTAYNKSPYVVQLTQGKNYAWGKSGPESSVTIAPYNSYTWDIADTNEGSTYNIYTFSLRVPQQGKNIKNYSAISNILIVNPSLTHTWYYNVGDPATMPYFGDKDPHTLDITINPDLTISTLGDGNEKVTWDSDSPKKEDYFNYYSEWNNKRVYDDVYGKLWTRTPYDYYMAHPETLPTDMKLVESSHDVLLVSGGHLNMVAGYQLNVQVSMNNIPGHPDAKCTFENGTNQLMIPGIAHSSNQKQVNLGGLEQNNINGPQDQSLPPPNQVIRDDFVQNFPLYPESYTNWTTSGYSKNLNITADDLDSNSYDIDIKPKVINTSIIFDTTPHITSKIMQQVGYLTNNSPISQTLSTSSYSKSVTDSSTKTLTNGWGVDWENEVSFKVSDVGISEHITLKYNGSYSSETTHSTTETIEAPSQNITVPPGCVAKADVILSNALIDSDYKAYGTLDKHLAYKMTTPWKNMKANIAANTFGSESKVLTRTQTKIGANGVLPW